MEAEDGTVTNTCSGCDGIQTTLSCGKARGDATKACFMLYSSSCGVVLFALSMLAGTRLLTAFRPVVQQARAQHQRLSVRKMAVLNMTPTELAKILNDKSLRAQYQIVDVREDSELHVALKDKDVIHLPLSQSNVWAEEIIEGSASLDKDMATVCVCHHGMRSKRVADFLGR